MDVCGSKGKLTGQNVPEMSHRPGFFTAKQPPPIGFPGGSDSKESAFYVGGVQSLVQEDPTRLGATKPMHHNYSACAVEPGGCDY